MWASVVVAHRVCSCGSRALEDRLNSCGTWAQLPHGMWDLLGPGIEPVSPAFARGCSTTEPPGKPNYYFAALHSMHDLCSLTRDQTRAPCMGSAKSLPLGHRGSPLSP